MQFPVTKQTFLEEYWQKKPLLMKEALPNFQTPLLPDELVEIALNPAVEARLISQYKGDWKVQYAPFSRSILQRKGLWTLLVQRLDHIRPEVYELKKLVSFLPDWRFDDIMVSYAVTGSGVGPHFDQYDVFLLQGMGCREWRLGPLCDENNPKIDHDELDLLAEIQIEAVYQVEPGDVVYIPPGVAHWGVATSDCMTFSLGFRAPSIAELLARRTDALLEQLDNTALLEDREAILRAGRSGEITPLHLQNIKDALTSVLDTFDDARWFGELVTESKYTDHLNPEHDIFKPSPNAEVRLAGDARVAWLERSNGIDVFINGEHLIAPKSTIGTLERLCSGQKLSLVRLKRRHSTLHELLIDQNALTACKQVDPDKKLPLD